MHVDKNRCDQLFEKALKSTTTTVVRHLAPEITTGTTEIKRAMKRYFLILKYFFNGRGGKEINRQREAGGLFALNWFIGLLV